MSTRDDRLLRVLQEAREQLERERQRHRENIAIVGLGCRLPGGVSGAGDFWRLLAEGVDATREIPADRWDVDAFFDADPGAPGRMYVRRGGFLDAIDAFEPEIFGISPREAAAMDPQQRLLLEVSWQALEDAGIAPDSLSGSATGVFVGLCFDDYARRGVSSGDPMRIDAYSALGTCRSVAAGRISYVLGLQGPALQLDTSCSSSLVALHLAAESLRRGECDLALVGGVNVMCSPEATIAFCKLRALAPDGRCKTFDASADGYARGEGCTMLVLQRQSDAERQGHRIRSLVRGSAVNHDGRSNGLTAPNGAAQEAVIRSALANAGVDPGDVDYVEAHGTGTKLGDPIEISALARAYRFGHDAATRLLVGSVKTNFGHLEGAAGVTGIAKAVLMLERGEIAPHLHFTTPNPHVPWDGLAITVASTRQAWPRDRRLAGVSSFGMSGTNAHVVLEGPPARPPVTPARPGLVVALAARTDRALSALAAAQVEALRALPADAIADACATLTTGRARFAHRLSVAAQDAAELIGGLERAAEGRRGPSVARGVSPPTPPRVAFVFSGQGAQSWGMGRELFADEPAFRSTLERAEEILGEPLLDVMYGPSDDQRIHETRWTQPALVAVECALAELWRSWGVTPSAVIGHSVGELSAAIVAGALDLESGLRLVQARGRAMQDLMPDAAMTAIRAPVDRVETLVARSGVAAAVASDNGPRATVVAGSADAITRVEAACKAEGLEAQRLQTRRAFHSSDVDPVLAPLGEAARGIRVRPPVVPLVSNLTGDVAGDGYGTADYWCRHARQRVRFADGLAALDRRGCTVFLEVGPTPVLLPLVKGVLPNAALLVPSLQPGQPDRTRMFASLGALWVAGVDADWSAAVGHPRQTVSLPTYPFERRRLWVEPVDQAAPSAPPAVAVEAPAQEPPGGARLADRIQEASPQDRAALVGAYVRETIAGLIRMGVDELPVDRPLHELGLDSLMLVELDAAIRRDLELDLPVQRVAQGSAADVAATLVAALDPGGPPAVSTPAYEADAVLDPAIHGREHPAAKPQAGMVLLTGATGFLGAHLLADLLEQPARRVLCLVRARNGAEASDRIRRNLERYGLWRPENAARIKAMAGDVAAPALGVGEDVFRELATRLEAIYNNAAHVSYVATYDELRASHVGGTREVLRMASLGGAVVHHVSSIAAFESTAYRGRTMSESTPPDEGAGIHLAYSQCKWVSERLVREAASRGLATTIYRPSLISGDSVSGAWNTNDFLCRMLKGMIRLGAAPVGIDLQLDFSPVDFVSRAIVHLSGQADAVGHAFHLHHPAPLDWSAMIDIVRSLGYAVEDVPYEGWVAKIEATRDESLFPLLPFFRHRWQPERLTYIELNQRAYRPALNCEATTAKLGQAGITCPALDRTLFGRYFQYLASVGFIDRAPEAP